MIITPCVNSFYRVDHLSKSVLEWVKTYVQPAYRFFEPTDKYGAKGWHIHESCVVDAAALTGKAGDSLRFTGAFPTDLQEAAQAAYDAAIRSRPPAKATQLSTNRSAYATLFLLPNAPPTIVEAVWKQLAKEHHPDVGGDPERFRLFNDAYRIIKGKQ